MQLNCKVIKKSGNPPFLYQPPLFSKIFGTTPSDSIFGRSYPPAPLNKGGGLQLCCEDFPSTTSQSCLLLRRNKAKDLTWNSIRLQFVKKTSMLNPVKNLGYISNPVKTLDLTPGHWNTGLLLLWEVAMGRRCLFSLGWPPF